MFVLGLIEDSCDLSVQNDCKKLSAPLNEEDNKDLVFSVTRCGHNAHHENQMQPKKSILKKTSLTPSNGSAGVTSSCNKSVTFAHMTKIAFIVSLHPVKGDIWFSNSDIRSFKSFSMFIAGALPVCPTSTDATCTSTGGWWTKIGHSRRGLECIYNKEEGQQRQQKAKELIQSVIKEQRLQEFIIKDVNQFSLAKFSMQLSQQARDLALATGSADAAAAKSDLIEEDNLSPNSPSVPSRRASAVSMMGKIKSFLFERRNVQKETSSAHDRRNLQRASSAPDVFTGNNNRKKRFFFRQ